MAKTLDELVAQDLGTMHLTVLRLQAENAALVERNKKLETEQAEAAKTIGDIVGERKGPT